MIYEAQRMYVMTIDLVFMLFDSSMLYSSRPYT